MREHFCTYFDHRYAAKGLAMWRSLKTHHPSATLHVLCLSDACREILDALRLTDVVLHSLNAIEKSDPDLVAARINRSLFEYYCTLTPVLPLYLFRTFDDVSRITYLDADLFFFADPGPVFDELRGASIGMIEHRHPDSHADLDRFGRFNVGWLTFCRDSQGLECLEGWRRQCLDWCYERVEPGRYADQKYLDEWPDRFAGSRVIRHCGANVGPWNLNRFTLSSEDGALTVDGQQLLFFHASGFVPASPGRERALGLHHYDVEETPLLAHAIYDTYEAAILAALAEIAGPLALALLADDPPREFETLKSQLEASERERRSSEEDRARRLDVIREMERELRASEADRAARLDVIREVQRELRASEEDRAARLEMIFALQKQLKGE